MSFCASQFCLEKCFFYFLFFALSCCSTSSCSLNVLFPLFCSLGISEVSRCLISIQVKNLYVGLMVYTGALLAHRHSCTNTHVHCKHCHTCELAHACTLTAGDVLHCILVYSGCPDSFTIMLIQWSSLQKWDNEMLTHTKLQLKSSTMMFQTEAGNLQIVPVVEHERVYNFLWPTLFVSSPACLSLSLPCFIYLV